MPDPVVNNLATTGISEGRNVPTGSKQQFNRNLCVSNTFKFQTSIFCKYNFLGNSGLCVEKYHPVYMPVYITKVYQHHVWWHRLLILPLYSGIVFEYLDLEMSLRLKQVYSQSKYF